MFQKELEFPTPIGRLIQYLAGIEDPFGIEVRLKFVIQAANRFRLLQWKELLLGDSNTMLPGDCSAQFQSGFE